MNRERALDLLTSSKPELQARFDVTRLALFGSTARDTASSGSAVDVLVAFDGPATSKRYFGVQFYGGFARLSGRPGYRKGLAAGAAPLH
nr:nucleotidyltransferase domain-containing protein [Chlorobaculum tepidum]